jgi:truncated hemoglobin YjbI
MSTVVHVRARTVAGFWATDYVPLVRSGQITDSMLAQAERDLRRLQAATASADEDGVGGAVPQVGWSMQGQLQVLVDYLRQEGVRDPVPGWEVNFPANLRFLIDVLAPQANVSDDPGEIVPPQEVVDRIGVERAVELVTTFYQLMLSQPELVVYFDGTRTGGIPVDVESLRGHFLAFVVSAFTGEQQYKDKPLRQALRDAHKKLDISGEHWRMTVDIFVTAMRMVEPPIEEPTIRAVVTGIAPYHDDVVSDKELDSTPGGRPHE